MISDDTLHALEFDRVRQIAADSAASELGRERLIALRPFAAAADAEQCMMRTAEMVKLLTGADFPIHGLRDARADLRDASVAGAALLPDGLLRIAATAFTAAQVAAFLSARRQAVPLLAELGRGIADLKDVVKRIEAAVAPDESIKDDASPALKRIRQAIRSETRTLENKMQSLLQKWSGAGYLQDAIISYRDGRLALPVKDEMRSRVQGVIVDSSASGATVFMEPVETLELSNRLRQLELDEKREIHQILLALTALIYGRLGELRAALAVLAELDEYYGRARLALRWNGTDAILTDRGRLRILSGRHPLLIERLKTKVIPLSLEIVPPLRAVVISGPNAGGKTVVLKTVGLFCIMAAAGLFVPAAPGTELPFFTGIHADIGDAQSIESDLSTFTAHVACLQRMTADDNSPKLLLVDEIGSSTDPALGGALAQAVLLEWVRQQAVVVVTTHHGSLKAFAHETAGIENGSMTFDETSLAPTYQFRPGVPGSSYALEIAERAGFPKALLETARSFIGKGMLGLEELVSELSRKIENYEQLRRASDLKLTEYGALQKLYTERTAELKRIRAEAKAKAVAEAEAMLQQTGREMETLIRDLKTEQASRGAIKVAREKLAALRENVETARKETAKTLSPAAEKREPLHSVTVGQRVDVEDLQGTGTVVSVQKNGKRAEVEIGDARLWVDVNKLYAPPEIERTARAPRVEMTFNLEARHVADRIDLRGKYGEEALPELDSFLAATVEANLSQVTVIHGKGTGALRAKVREFLDTHPLVRSFHDGGRNSDDFGSTVVELK